MTTLTIEKLYREQIQYLSMTELETLMQLIQSRLTPRSNDKPVSDLPIMLQIEPGKSALSAFLESESYQALAKVTSDYHFMMEDDFIVAVEQIQKTVIPENGNSSFNNRINWLKQLTKVGRQMRLNRTVSVHQPPKTLAEYKLCLARHNAELELFEKQYDMESAKFYEQFENGVLGDSMDFFQWSSAFEMKIHLIDKIKQLGKIE